MIKNNYITIPCHNETPEIPNQIKNSEILKQKENIKVRYNNENLILYKKFINQQNLM